MTPTSRWVLASHNQGKVREFQAWAEPLGIELTSAAELDLPNIDEPYITFLENALHKAREVSKLTGLPALSDDSGLCVPALGGSPGVYSARFAGEPCNDERNNAALLKALEDVEDRRAYYYAILVLCEHPNDPQPCIAQGQWWGRITYTPSGEGGFGYDPLFLDEEEGITAASLPFHVKQALSHRGQALRALETLVKNRFVLPSPIY